MVKAWQRAEALPAILVISSSILTATCSLSFVRVPFPPIGDERAFTRRIQGVSGNNVVYGSVQFWMRLAICGSDRFGPTVVGEARACTLETDLPLTGVIPAGIARENISIGLCGLKLAAQAAIRALERHNGRCSLAASARNLLQHWRCFEGARECASCPATPVS